MKALLKNYKQSPRKVRLVADLIRGKSVPQAKQALSFLPKKSAPVMEKLLDSAIANARSMGSHADDLFVKTVTVDKGTVMRRYRPFARGRSGTMRKTMSIVRLELGAYTSASKVPSAPKPAAKKTVKKVAAKKK